MKSQAFFSSKYKSEKLKCPLLEFLFGTLRVNIHIKLHKTVLRRVHILGVFNGDTLHDTCVMQCVPV